MLSKPAAILLGLIAEKPANAYELTQSLRLMNVKRWYPVADSTIYATVRVLEKKAYLAGKIQKDGNMPEKTIYTITDTGIRELKSALRFFIENFDYDLTAFMIAAFFVDTFEDGEMLEIFENRLTRLNKIREGLSSRQAEIQARTTPEHVGCILRHSERIIRAEIESANQFIKILRRKRDRAE